MPLEIASVEAINIFKDVVVPLISALVGGLLALIGVVITLYWDKKKDEEEKKQAVKPWIYSIDPMEDYDYKKAIDVVMATSTDANSTLCVQIIIKNTDNGICILDELITETKRYIPILGKVLDKGTITNLNIWFETGETLKDMYLYVKDIYGNKYKYKVCPINSIIKGYVIEEVSM